MKQEETEQLKKLVVDGYVGKHCYVEVDWETGGEGEEGERKNIIIKASVKLVGGTRVARKIVEFLPVADVADMLGKMLNDALQVSFKEELEELGWAMDKIKEAKKEDG